MKRISVLMATAFVDMIGFAIVFPLLPFYALRFNADVWLIGWLIAAFSVMQLASAPLWGRFSDRYGRRPAILLGLLTSAFAFWSSQPRTASSCCSFPVWCRALAGGQQPCSRRMSETRSRPRIAPKRSDGFRPPRPPA